MACPWLGSFPFPDGAAASFSGYACELRVRDYYLNFVHRSTENSTVFFAPANRQQNQLSGVSDMANDEQNSLAGPAHCPVGLRRAAVATWLFCRFFWCAFA